MSIHPEQYTFFVIGGLSHFAYPVIMTGTLRSQTQHANPTPHIQETGTVHPRGP